MSNIPTPPPGFVPMPSEHTTQTTNIPTPPPGFVPMTSEHSGFGLQAEIQGAAVPQVKELSGTDTTPNSQPTVNQDGTISTLTTGQPADYLGNPKVAAEQAGQVVGQVGAGLAEPVLGAAKVVTDSTAGPINAAVNYALNETGTSAPQNIVDGAIKSLHNYTTAYNKAHPNQPIHPSTLGNLLTYSLVPGGGESVAAQAALGGTLSFISSLGDNKSYDDATKNAIIGAAVTGASSKLLSTVFNHLDPLNKQAKLLIKLDQNRISKAQAINMLKGIPKKDQVISLANSIHLAKNYFGAAVGTDSRLAAKLGARLEAHQSILKPFVADAKEVDNVKQAYSNMADYINNKYTEVLNATHIQQQLNDKMLEPYATDPSALATNLKKIKRDVSEPISTGQALEIYKNINNVIKKPAVISDRKVKTALGNIKGQLLDFMNTSIKNPDDMKMVNQAIHNYKETMNRQQLGEIIAKNTNSKYATDYGKVLADVKKEHLIGKNTDFVIPILKEMQSKFGNDKYLSNVIDPKGQPHTLSALGARSVVIDKLYDLVSPIVNRSRYKDIQLRKAIIKSIKRGDTKSPLSFIDDLVKNKTMTLPQVNELKQEVPEAFAQLEHKPQAETTGDVTLTPKYVGSNGTVSTNASEAALHDAQINMIRDNLSGKHSDKVINKVNTILNSKRTNIINATRAVADRMKADDIQGNMKMLRKTIQTETDRMVSRINKDHGVKLPPKEVEKIYQMKIKKLIKDLK